MQNSCLKTKERKTCFPKMYMGRPWWKQIQGKTISKWWRVRGGEELAKIVYELHYKTSLPFFISIKILLKVTTIYSCIYVYTLLVCMSVCLSVRLCPINVKTAEPIGPKFFVGPRVTEGKVYG